MTHSLPTRRSVDFEIGADLFDRYRSGCVGQECQTVEGAADDARAWPFIAMLGHILSSAFKLWLAHAPWSRRAMPPPVTCVLPMRAFGRSAESRVGKASVSTCRPW